MSKIYCYLRVSTDKQEHERQETVLKNSGYINGTNCEYISETYTGKTIKRPIYDELIEKMQPYDSLVVESLTRLSRAGIVETLKEVAELVQNKKINVVILKENFNLRAGEKPDANTNMLLGIFSVLAQFERDLISERTKEALASKKINGTLSGRPLGKPAGENSTFENFVNVLKCIDEGIKVKDAFKKCNFPKPTYYLWLNKYCKLYGCKTPKTLLQRIKENGGVEE